MDQDEQRRGDKHLSCTHIPVLLCAAFLNIRVCSVEGQAHGKTNAPANLPDSILLPHPLALSQLQAPCQKIRRKSRTAKSFRFSQKAGRHFDLGSLEHGSCVGPRGACLSSTAI